MIHQSHTILSGMTESTGKRVIMMRHGVWDVEERDRSKRRENET